MRRYLPDRATQHFYLLGGIHAKDVITSGNLDLNMKKTISSKFMFVNHRVNFNISLYEQCSSRQYLHDLQASRRENILGERGEDNDRRLFRDLAAGDTIYLSTAADTDREKHLSILCTRAASAAL